MATFEVGPGIIVRVPNDVSVRSVAGRATSRRRAARVAPENDALKQALSSADFTLASQIDLVPRKAGIRPLRRSRGLTPAIEVKVGASESAVILVEGAGGVYGWSYPEAAPTRRPGVRARAGERVLVFNLVTGAAAAPRRGARRPPRRGLALDWIADTLIEPVRAYVLKFVTRSVIDIGVEYVEGDKPTGLVSLAGDDPVQWRPVGSAVPALPKDRPANILLMVHGTFSSTAGSFGALTVQATGRAFLTKARERYDAVLGFDHKTLAETPEVNAAGLMEALETLGLPKHSTIDAIAFSRGGLVYRILAEDLLAKRRPDIKLGKAVFVGATNNGTHLAESKNWVAMVDLYTNLIMAGARALIVLAGGAAFSPLVSVGIRTLGRFVQMLSEVAITDNRVPGLAAMKPASASIKTLNQAQGGLDRLANYYAITSNFVATLEPKNGITRELGQLLLDRVTNRLFRVDNDLVVDTPSMTECGTRDERFRLGDTFAFGDTKDVYHTIYFANAQVAMLLSRWLGLEQIEEEWTRRGGPKAESRRARDDLEFVEVAGYVNEQERALMAEEVEDVEVESVEDVEENEQGEEGEYEEGEEDEEDEKDEGEEGEEGEAVEEGEEEEQGEADEEGGDDSPRPRSAAVRSPEKRPSHADRGKTAAPTKALTAPDVLCHFAAEMDPSPPVKKRVPLYVTVSREIIAAEKSATSKTTAEPVKVDLLRKIVVEVIARKNARVVGEAQVEIDVPKGRPETLRFELEGVDPGVADILVEARQGPRVLVSFVLAPVFVSTEKKLKQSQSVLAEPQGLIDPAVLRIYEIYESSSRLTLRFDLTCFDPNISVSESRQLPSGFSRDLYVSDTLRDIEEAWTVSVRAYEQFLYRLKAKGMEMANWFLPDPVRQALWQHRDQIRAIQVISEEPLIPWELLYVTDPQAGPEGKGFLSEWGLVRWLHNTRWPTRRLALSPNRVRYVIPNYVDPDLRLKGATEERAMIKRQFTDAKEVRAESVAVANFLQKEAKDCDLLHFACHGEATQRAVLNADLLMAGTRTKEGITDDPLSAQLVKSYARFATDSPNPIVFVNACQTGRAGAGLGGVGGFADAFLRPSSKCGAGAFVGALWSVDDKLAFSFAETFYGELKMGRTLVEAAQSARDLAKTRQEFTWLAYTVYGNPFARVD
jgi:hypothetical protein